MSIPVPTRRTALIALAAAVALAACEDPFASQRPLPPEPTTVSLGDFRTAPLDARTAFRMSERVPVPPNQVPDWDFAFWVTEAGAPQFRPRGTIVDGTSEAGLAPVDDGFGALSEAPLDGYVTAEPVPVDSGEVYAVRSRPDPTVRATTCRRYGKIEVTSVDPEDGTVTFRHLVNPNCEQRDLTPGGEEEE